MKKKDKYLELIKHLETLNELDNGINDMYDHRRYLNEKIDRLKTELDIQEVGE